jgi:hypothetical protein
VSVAEGGAEGERFAATIVAEEQEAK